MDGVRWYHDFKKIAKWPKGIGVMWSVFYWTLIDNSTTEYMYIWKHILFDIWLRTFIKKYYINIGLHIFWSLDYPIQEPINVSL